MPRRPRFDTGGYVYHALNRVRPGTALFEIPGDYLAFEHLLLETRNRVPLRLLAYCLMPNHWHLLLWPREDGQLSEYLRLATVTHVQRWHAAHGTAGSGALYQGRFKSFPVQNDTHFYTVCRYVERNALRANLIDRAENWRWGSLWWHSVNRTDVLDAWPLDRPAGWIAHVNTPQTRDELEAVRHSVRRGTPFGGRLWTSEAARRLSLGQTLHGRGRPRIYSNLEKDSRPLF